MTEKEPNRLTFRSLGISTQHEHIVFMRSDSEVCISEGFEALTRVKIRYKDRTIIASLNVFTNGHLIEKNEVSLSDSAQSALEISDGEELIINHVSPVLSLSYVRSKIYGKKLTRNQLREIIIDIAEGKYSNIHLAAFITACAGKNMTTGEVTSLTHEMISVGNRMTWDYPVVADKHSVGGLPGNRTTPIVVSIAAAAGLIIPKTSSRSITSPSGTTDTMEVITPVELGLDKIKEVVEKEGGCIAWGGNAGLSPTDDILIRVEKAIDLDVEGQMVASVLSKKSAAGSTHVVIDIPVGKTAKVRSMEEADRLKKLFEIVAKKIGLQIKILISDGTQPVGRGIGPALEAMDVLSVLRNEKEAPEDLRERSLLLAGSLLELTNHCKEGTGISRAAEILTSGAAYKKFMKICEAQGGFHEPSPALFIKEVTAETDGIVIEIDNRRLAKIAKLAGAPRDQGAGVSFHAPVGKKVKNGQVLYRIYASSRGELEYALNYMKSENGNNIIRIRE